MNITVKLVLKVDNELENELSNYERIMKHEIYRIAGVFKKEKRVFEFRYKFISNAVSWYSKSIVLEQAKIYYEKERQGKKPKLDFSSIWSDYSYKIIETGLLLLELGVSEHKRNLKVPFYVHEQQMQRIKMGKVKEMVIQHQGIHWFAFVNVEIHVPDKKGNIKMGIDVGMKIPAVSYTSSGKVKFFGNGRMIRYYQRRYRKHIQMMQKKHQYKKLRNFEHKLHHILRNFDHQISSEIIRYAIQEHVVEIRMERLTNINKQFNVKYTKDIYLWSYRRLQTFIAYKAKLAGIKVCYVSAYNTSKKCPKCGKINRPNDRTYQCSCGFKAHRDVVGAQNILHVL